MVLQNIFFGIILIVIGTVMIKYNYQLVGIVGHIPSVEARLGSGSTYGFFQLIAVLLVLFGILTATGLGTVVMRFLLSPLIRMFSLGGTS